MLAVTLGHLECIRILLKYDTNVNVINKAGWTVVQEAVATGDPEILQASHISNPEPPKPVENDLFFSLCWCGATASATTVAWAASRTCSRS